MLSSTGFASLLVAKLCSSGRVLVCRRGLAGQAGNILHLVGLAQAD
jgi:hypothetical protein